MCLVSMLKRNMWLRALSKQNILQNSIMIFYKK